MKRDRRQILTELLVLSAQAGSEQAFRQLHELWAADFRRMALVRIQHGGDIDLVTQDAWLAIARGLSQIDDPACFPRWAFRIVERRSADWIRRRRSERQRAEVLQREPETVPPVGSELGDRRDAAAERIAQVVAALDEDARELVFLFYHADRSIAEIATILGIPVGTVKSRLFKVRETIKQQIERMTDERLG